MFIALTSLLIAAAPAAAGSATYSVAVTRHVGLDAAAALDLAEGFSSALERQGDALPGKRLSARALAASLAAANSDPTSCGGEVDCAAVMGKVGGVYWLFALQLAKVGSNIIVQVDLVRVHDAALLASANKPVSYQEPGSDLEALAKEIVESAQPIQPPADTAAVAAAQAADDTSDAPASPAPVEPGPTAEPPLLGLWPGQLAAIGLGALALGAVGTGGVLGVVALGQSDELRSNVATYDDDRERVLWTARGADIAYAVGGALAIAGAVVWFVLGEPSADAGDGVAATGK